CPTAKSPKGFLSRCAPSRDTFIASLPSWISSTATSSSPSYVPRGKRLRQDFGRASQPVDCNSFRALAIVRFVADGSRHGRVAQVVGCVGRSRTDDRPFGGWPLLRGRLQCTRRRVGRWNRDQVVCSRCGGSVRREVVRGDNRFACCGASV